MDLSNRARVRAALQDNIKSREEAIDDMIEAVQHAETIDAELALVKHTVAELRNELAQHRRIIGALCARGPSGYRLEHKALQANHGFTVRDQHGALYVQLAVP